MYMQHYFFVTLNFLSITSIHDNTEYCLGARKVWLISACAYHSRWQGNMRLLEDVRLIGSEILAPPTACRFERSSTKPASYELGDS